MAASMEKNFAYSALSSSGGAPGGSQTMGRANSTAAHHDVDHVSPSYRILLEAGLLETSYRIYSVSDVALWQANSSPTQNCLASCFLCLCNGTCVHRTEINAGKVGLLEDGRGGFHFLGKGMHCFCDLYYRIRKAKSLLEDEIVHGDRGIITVRQGFIGVAEDRGQTVLLPPGLHQYHSASFKFLRSVDLTESVIRIGPYTIVTVDEGYTAITQDNGRMVCLSGGETYMLKHRNHKFEMFISQKVQTSDLPEIKAATADNVVIAVSATVNWRITHPETAARMAADTMRGNKRKATSGLEQFDMSSLRNDVLKQAEASLSAYVGLVRYSDNFGVSAAVQQATGRTAPDPVTAAVVGESDNAKGRKEEEVKSAPLFDFERLQGMINHANEVTARYGVEIFSINVISAFPSDKALMQSLAKGAVAAAEARQAETAAWGRSKALQIQSKGEAIACITQAKAEAEAEQIRAAGSRAAADDLAKNGVAVDLARIDRMGAAFSDKTTYFFGANPDALHGAISNPKLVSKN